MEPYHRKNCLCLLCVRAMERGLQEIREDLRTSSVTFNRKRIGEIEDYLRAKGDRMEERARGE